MRRPLLALVLLALGCGDSSPPATTADAQSDAQAQAVTPPAAGADMSKTGQVVAPEGSPTPAPPSGDDPCSRASLAMAGSTVVATVDGEPIRADALGDDVREAERDALHEYCRQIYGIREAATRRAVEDRLLDNAARAEGVATEVFVRSKLEAGVKEPSDDEIAAFYDANKNEQAPPLEAVKGQVAEAMIKDRSKAVYDELMGSLRGKAEVKTTLPDVRPPPYDLKAAAHTATHGPAEARVTLVEFSDFECPYCARAATGLSAVKDRLGDEVQVAYRHFPLSFHPSAQPAAEISQCAHEQGKFWAMHDEIFENQRGLSPESLMGMAERVGLDMEKLAECMGSGRARQQVMADLEKGREVGVRGTPSFYINGRAYSGGTSPDELVAAVEEALAGS